MRSPAAPFPIALALGAMILTPRAGVQAQDAREGPKEIEKCQTISRPGSYKLVNNLTGPFSSAGDCLIITADEVTIDLTGFTISGPGPGHGTNGSGIVAKPPSNQVLRGLAVRNGSISGFIFGVVLRAIDQSGNPTCDVPSLAPASIVEGLRVVGNAEPPDFSGLTGIGIVSEGIVRNNTATGFRVGMDASGTVTGNYGVLNHDVGLLTCPGSTVIGNTFMFSENPINVLCPSNVTNNTASGIILFGDGCSNTNNVGLVTVEPQ